ncbi:MAG: FtsK/SpoIIIE domain-containing protein [Candidatus Pacebacteria bacterium]|nr:FtsK/SpoIIIE domain-containing protein [Candidatus Paceibacterota bacterium]
MNTNLSINIGKDEYGKDLTIDLVEAKHLLVAGSTGSGKSTLIHRIITTFISNNSPEDLRFILIDPKRVELTMYDKIPYLLTPTIIDPKQAVLALKHMVKEMGRRYDTLKKADCTDISTYQSDEEFMPRIVIVIDEFSDLMQTYPKEIEPAVVKLASMGHIVGIHLIVSTSRPSTKVYTKAMQEVFTSRVGLQMGSTADSKLIVGTDAAVILRGSGDILFRMGMKYVIRAQVREIGEHDIKKLVSALVERYSDIVVPELQTSESDMGEYENDDMYEPAKEAVIASGKASTAFLQRKLGIGYSRSAKIIDMLEERGVIGPARGDKPREVIQTKTVH